MRRARPACSGAAQPRSALRRARDVHAEQHAHRLERAVAGAVAGDVAGARLGELLRQPAMFIRAKAARSRSWRCSASASRGAVRHHRGARAALQRARPERVPRPADRREVTACVAAVIADHTERAKMKAHFRVLDSDLQSAIEPGNLYDRYLDPAFRDRTPRPTATRGAYTSQWTVGDFTFPRPLGRGREDAEKRAALRAGARRRRALRLGVAGCALWSSKGSTSRCCSAPRRSSASTRSSRVRRARSAGRGTLGGGFPQAGPRRGCRRRRSLTLHDATLAAGRAPAVRQGARLRRARR